MDLRKPAAALLALALVAVPVRAADLAETIAKHPKLAKLAAALKESGVLELLKKPGPFTVLAPYDDAFQRVGEDRMKALRQSPEDFRKVLRYHVIKGKHSIAEWVKRGERKIATAAGEKLTLKLDRKAVIFWDGIHTANVLQHDIAADNGVIHIIDAVELPPAPKM